MKTKIYITLAILVIAVSAKAQSDAISTYFSEYLEDESITQISMGSKAFEMIGGFSAQSESGNAFEKLSSQIDGLKMVVLHDLENSRTTALAACQKVRNRFEDLITVTDKDAYVNVMIRENGGLVSEVFAVIGTHENLVLASINGHMMLKDVARLSSDLTSLSKGQMDNSSGVPIEFRIYPNPAARGSSLTLSMDGDYKGAMVRIYNASGKEVDNFALNSKDMKYDTSKIGKGSFVLKLTRGERIHTEKFIVQ